MGRVSEARPFKGFSGIVIFFIRSAFSEKYLIVEKEGEGVGYLYLKLMFFLVGSVSFCCLSSFY